MATSRAVIFANGQMRNAEAVRRELLPEDFLIAADGGLRHLRKLRRLPHVIVGDLDSLPKGEKRKLERAKIRVVHHPADKDQTDLELTLDLAVQEGHAPILVLAPFGGRVDQTLANLLLLNREDLRERSIRLFDGQTEAFVIAGHASVRGRQGDVVSLIPLAGEVQGIVTQGLHYPLHEEPLHLSRTRGVSNRLSDPVANIAVREGLLLCIHIFQHHRARVQGPATSRGRSK